MDLGIQGKKALVTAASRGLGNSAARCLAREGAELILVSRNEKDLALLKKELNGDFHTTVPIDLLENSGPKKLLDWLKHEEIYPDIVVHNLGGNLGIKDPFCSVDDWQKVMRFNLEIAIELNLTLIPQMQEKKWGRVCHVSSISSLENQGSPSYCAAKAALNAYSRSLGRYVAKDGVVLTTILPGAVFTEGGYWDEALKNEPDRVQKYLEERMAIQRFGKPNEIGQVVAFLCSQMASFCVGSSFMFDGGQGRVFQHIE